MQTAQTTASKTTTQWSAIAMALLAGVIAAGHVGKLPPALPAIRSELAVGMVTAGWLASIFSVTGMLIAIYFGAVADRIGYWRLAVAGLALMAISGLYGSMASDIEQLIFSRFLEGIGFLAVVVAAPAIIARAAIGRDRSMALGFWPGYMPCGVSLMVLVAPFALRMGGWRGLWLDVAVLAALGAAAMWAIGRNAPGPNANDARMPIWQNLRAGGARAGPWLVGGCFALYGAQLYAIITWMPTFMIEQRGVGTATAAALTALVVACNGACNIFGGWLLHRGATPWAMIVLSGAIMAVAAVGSFAAWVPDIVRYAFSLLLGGAGGLVASAVFAIAPAFAASPAQLGIVNGILVQASNLAQFVGATAIAMIVARFGRWESALWAMVALNLALILLALLVHRYEEQHQEKPLPA
jgi:predicted MFS family arabinose efflux permease